MANKFNRNFKLTIQSNAVANYYSSDIFQNKEVRLTPSLNVLADDEANYQEGETAVEIRPPFTIEVDIKRGIGSSDNVAHIRIYGLSEKIRNELFKDKFNIPHISYGTPFRTVVLEGGYGNDLYPNFIGSLIQGYSTREGVDQITHLHCLSSGVGIYNTFINQTYGANTSYNTVIEGVIAELEKSGDVSKGAITKLDGKFASGMLAQGMTFNVLSQFGQDVFIDLNKINVMKINEVLGTIDPQNILTISASTGLLGTPVRTGVFVMIKTMYEPKMRLGMLINLQTDTAKFMNGIYKVYSVAHTGIFSNTKSGPLITTLGLFMGDKAIKSWESIGE